MDYFIARYEENGIPRSKRFSKAQFTQEKADAWLQSNGVQSFLFFFEPNPVQDLDENSVLFKGDIGFDITLNRLLPYLKSGKKIVVDSPGGSLYEAYSILDAVSEMGISPDFVGMGIVASAATLLTVGKTATENTRFLIHNPWVFDAGDAKSHERAAAMLRSEIDVLAKMYAKGSEKSETYFKNLMDEEKFITAKEAKSIGLISAIKRNNYITKNEKKMETEEKVKKLEETTNRFQNVLAALSKAIIGKPKNEEHEGEETGDPDDPEVLKTRIEELEAELVAKDAKIKELEEKLGETSAEKEEMGAKLNELASVQDEVKSALDELKTIKSEFKVESRKTDFKEPKSKKPTGLDKERLEEIKRIRNSKK